MMADGTCCLLLILTCQMFFSPNMFFSCGLQLPQNHLIDLYPNNLSPSLAAVYSHLSFPAQ